VLCAAVMLVIPSLAGAQVGEMVSVSIDAPGHVVDIPFELDKPSAVSVQAFFPPADVGQIKFTVTDDADQPVDITPPKILKPGAYSVAVSASGVSSESFSVKIGVFEPADAYEPNDTQQTATPITLPLRTVIVSDRGSDNLDWFKFSIDQAYLLSVHLRTRRGSSVRFKVVDAEGKSFYETSSSWDSAGARYASLAPGQYYLVVGPASSSDTTEMELALYDPVGVAGDSGGFIALGMKEGSAGLNQLMLIAKTSGKGLVETLSPEVMKAELVEAVKDKPVETKEEESSGRLFFWLVTLLLLAASGAAGFWMKSRFKKRPKTGGAEPEPASDDSDSNDSEQDTPESD